MKHLFKTKKKLIGGRTAAVRNISKKRNCTLEPLERREVAHRQHLANGVGTDIEYSGPFGTFMPVGSPAYNGYSSFGNIDVPATPLR